MKLRTLTLVVGILLMASFIALNLDQILQPTTLNLGFSQVEAPLGLVMLGVVVVVLAFFLVALVFLQTSHLLELRRATKDANEQRQLADKAEQSRFTELRVFLQIQQQDELTREEVRANRSLARLAELETKLLTTLEQTANGLSASIGEVEDRLERQIQKMEQTSK